MVWSYFFVSYLPCFTWEKKVVEGKDNILRWVEAKNGLFCESYVQGPGA